MHLLGTHTEMRIHYGRGIQVWQRTHKEQSTTQIQDNYFAFQTGLKLYTDGKEI